MEALKGKKIIHVSVGALHCLTVTDSGQVCVENISYCITSYAKSLFVCLSVCHAPLAPSVLQGCRPQPRHLSPWALGTCAPLCPPSHLDGKGSSCRPAIGIVLSTACSALWRYLTNESHLMVLLPIGWVLCWSMIIFCHLFYHHRQLQV